MVLYRRSFSGPVGSRNASARSNSTLLLMLCQARATGRTYRWPISPTRSLSMMAVGPTASTGSSRRLFQATMRPAELPSTPLRNSASQEIRPAFHTRTRTAAGTMSFRTAAIGQLPKSGVEETSTAPQERRRPPFLSPWPLQRGGVDWQLSQALASCCEDRVGDCRNDG
jgi:hypothetical protein